MEETGVWPVGLSEAKPAFLVSIGSPVLEVGSESSKNVTDFGDEGPDIDILS